MGLLVEMVAWDWVGLGGQSMVPLGRGFLLKEVETGLLPKDITTEVPQPELPSVVGIPNSSHQFSAEASSSSRSTSFSSYSSSGGSSPGLTQAGPAELGLPRSLMNHDGLRRYNMGGIAEVYSFK